MPPNLLQFQSNRNRLMRSLLPIAFSIITTLVGLSVHQSARATVDAQQERQADLICQVDPTTCS
jgi:hypothetical protein